MRFRKKMSDRTNEVRNRLAEWGARKSIRAATLTARSQLRKTGATPRILIDTDVIRSGVTHTNCWVDTGELLWGGRVSVKTGYRARIPKKVSDDRQRTEKSYLPGIADLASTEFLDLYTYRQLEIEQWRQPIRAKTGDALGVSIFKDVPIKRLEMLVPFRSSLVHADIFPSKERQIELLQKIPDDEWREMQKTVGSVHLLDAFHLLTAHKNKIDFFLTMEKKFPNHIRTLKGQGKLSWITCELVNPSELGQRLSIRPVDIRLLGLICRPFPNSVIFNRN